MAKNKDKNSVFAAIGAATGLGNAFRFPALCSTYGCSFLFAYALCLALVCYPLLCAELEFGKRKDCGGVFRAISRAAAANSFIISLYYFVVTVKLGSACIGGAAGVQGGAGIFIPAVLISGLAAYFLLRGGRRALSVTGKISVYAFLILFLSLSVIGVFCGVSPFKSYPPSLSAFKRGALWADAMGQSLLSLSLAAGVMPAFARGLPAVKSVKGVAAKIALANFTGCALAFYGTLSLVGNFSCAEGICSAFSVFSQIISRLSKNTLSARLYAFLIYFALTAVAMHSMCSLALPALSALPKKFSRTSPVAFVALSAALFPLFCWNSCQILNACDRMACSVVAVGVAFSESLCFAFGGNKNPFLLYVCPVACGALAALSFCGARFNLFSPLAKTCAYTLCLFIIISAAAPPLFHRAKNLMRTIDKRT